MGSLLAPADSQGQVGHPQLLGSKEMGFSGATFVSRQLLSPGVKGSAVWGKQLAPGRTRGRLGCPMLPMTASPGVAWGSPPHGSWPFPWEGISELGVQPLGLLVGSISTWLAADVVQGVTTFQPPSLPPFLPPSLPSALPLALSLFLFHFFLFPFLFLFLFPLFLSFFLSFAAS